MNNGIAFGKIPTLSTITWSSDKLKQSWKWRARSMESVMQRFIELNRKNLEYLGISGSIVSEEGKPCLRLTTSKYIGAIPIKSPVNGKEVGDLVVAGRFGENASELITLLDNTIKPDYSDEFHLVQDSQMTPPIFIECCKYIDTYIEVERINWRKFDNVVKVQRQASSSTLWGEYAIRTAQNPLEFSTFHNKCNVLTTDHEEMAQLNYILTLAIAELESVRVPIRTRTAYSSKVSLLKSRLYDKSIKATEKIRIRMSDPFLVKQLKKIGLLILNNKTNEKLAWRMDYAEFFERYVQYLLRDVSVKKGARTIDNPHYVAKTQRKPTWSLGYLEPDLIIQKNELQIVVDAKYKSHIFNWNDRSDDLKETFRHDLHQILAYCSFNNMPTKQAMLVYPFTDFTYHKMKLTSPLSRTDADVYLVGIPLEKSKLEEVKEKISEIVTFNS